MLPWHISLNVSGDTVILIDCDGTERVFIRSATPRGTYVANKEEDVLTDDGNEYILTRFNGDKWYFGFTDGILRRIVSRTGHQITITRDINNRIAKITDGFGRETQFLYINIGSATRLNEIREPAPNDVGWFSTFLHYDNDNRLSTVINPMGDTQRFEYNAGGLLSKVYDEHGNETTYGYDGTKVNSIIDANNKTTLITYDVITNTAIVRNRIGKEKQFKFDQNGRIEKITDELLNEHEFVWNSNTWELEMEFLPKIPIFGMPWSRQKIVYTYGTTTETQHELKRREVRKITDTDATGIFLADYQWTHNLYHDVLTETDEEGNVTTYTYKLNSSGVSTGLRETEKNGENQIYVTRTFDTEANKFTLLAETNGVNKTINYLYNQNSANSYGKPDRIITPEGNITNLKIDIRGRVYEITDPTGNPVKITYDSLDRPIKVFFSDGSGVERVYECCHLIAEIDANGNSVFREYDNLGRLVKETDANGNSTSYGYNDEGWLTSITDPRGKVTFISYDDAGRITQIDYPGGWQEFFTYYEPGHLKSYKAKKGADDTLINYIYNDLYQLIKKEYPSGTNTEFDWYKNGLKKTMKDASGEKRYRYDRAKRLLEIVQGPVGFVDGTNHNFKLEYFWDAASQLTQKRVTIRTLGSKIWSQTFTDDGNLDTVTNPDGDVTKHEWHMDGRLKKITLKFNTLNKRETREFFYQDTNDLHFYQANKNKYLRKVLDKKNDGTVISSFEYELDLAGVRQSLKDKDGKYESFLYDKTYQLHSDTKWTLKTGGTREWQYAFYNDHAGNRLVEFIDGVPKTFAYGENNEMLQAGMEIFTYDHFGNTKTKTTGGQTTNYEWDFERNLIGITYPGAIGNDAHEYDGEGMRMRSKLVGATDWTHFIHDELSGELLIEYTFINNVYEIRSEYTWSIGLISMNRGGAKRYFHFDGIGSTVVLTDFDMNVTDMYVWSAFGVLKSSSGTSVNPFRYVGQWGYYDDGARGSQSGLLRVGMRYYSPNHGRFWSLDSLFGQNRYLYAGSNPVNAIDPTGEAPILLWILCALACGLLLNSIIAEWDYCDDQCERSRNYWTCMLNCLADKVCEGTTKTAACTACLLCICAIFRVPGCRALLKKIFKKI
ncbi:MAG TPA: RHS repeat-associated core domain-containing protein [Fimbriimonadales bacterium]|nr:RHS repeat-associated core domain-containing protein [Fimbriimonadales bacterium]